MSVISDDDCANCEKYVETIPHVFFCNLFRKTTFM